MPVDDVKGFRLQAEVQGLMDTLTERDRFIRKLSNDVLDLQNKNLDLQEQLTQFSAADSGRGVPGDQTGVPASGIRVYDFSASREEIGGLETVLRDTLTKTQVDAAVIAELEDVRLRRDIAVNILAEQTAELATAKNQVTVAQIENDDLKERLIQETQTANAASRELQIIRQRVDLSFTASQLSGYLSRAIDNFNHEANAGDLSVNYIINGMEVTFKADLTKNDTGEMTLAAPSLTGGDESLSTIKFSITAIPKEERGES